MTHTTSNESFDKSLDETLDGSVEHNPSPLPTTSGKRWGLLMGGALVLVCGAWGILQLTHSPQPVERASVPAIAVQTLTLHS
ncbi:MAG TPA: hypothetical protein V6C78_10870, partial [Crinalium sp.]